MVDHHLHKVSATIIKNCVLDEVAKVEPEGVVRVIEEHLVVLKVD